MCESGKKKLGTNYSLFPSSVKLSDFLFTPRRKIFYFLCETDWKNIFVFSCETEWKKCFHNFPKKVFIQFYTEQFIFFKIFYFSKNEKIEFFFMDVKKKWRERCFKHMLTLRLIKCDFISSFRPQSDFGSPVLPVETDWHVLTHDALLLINSSWIWRVSPGWTRPWEESIFPGWVRQQESRVSVWIILFT